MMAPRKDSSSLSWTNKGGMNAILSLPSTLENMKDSYIVVGKMSGKVTWGRTLKLTSLCGGAKRKGFRVRRREVAKR